MTHPGSVDNVYPIFHLCKLLVTEQTPRLGCQWAIDGDDIGLGE